MPHADAMEYRRAGSEVPQVDGAVARITLNRPGKRNAIDQRTIEELREALEKSSGDGETRVVLLAAEGSDFCSGMDLQMMAQTVDAGADQHLQDAGSPAGGFCINPCGTIPGP